ncbi:MAG: biotin--[acetyl-CoA-carboxylase] ligase [Christensenella sp.]
MKKEILQLLISAEDFISGEQISDKLNISRAAVWKYIKAIKEEGGVIEAHTKRGYKLVSFPDVLKPEYVNFWIEKPHGELEWLNEVDSTNEYAKLKAREGAQGGSVYVAERQTKGKGRMARGWIADAGDAIMMSVILRPAFEPTKAPAVTFAAALGVVDAVRRVCGVDTKIKWPNDIVYNGKKICGILTEMSSDMDSVEYIVCGMGLNVNQEKFVDEIAQKAISLRMIVGNKINRVQLCGALTDSVFDYYEKYVEGGIDAIFDEYCANSVIIGKEIKVLSANETVTGICVGFTRQGALVLNADGEKRTFLAGEVSVRAGEEYI